MLARNSPIWRAWIVLLRVCEATAQGGGSDPRSLAAAIQNIHGTSSVLSLLPVLTGKTHNIKAVAARTFPGSLAILGVGAGRVLSKLQTGLMLLSTDLYRNVVDDLSAPHQEYVNAFSPSLVHVPTGTPERRSSNTVVNHNLTEDYMVEAWFQTQGLPAKVELSQGNTRRLLCGLLAYLLMYALETFLAAQNAVTGTAIPLVVLQVVSGLLWILAVCLLQAARGQGTRFIYLNRLMTTEYRCFQIALSGRHVQSAVLSTQLDNIRGYNLFGAKYESRRLKLVGAVTVLSGVIDLFTTFLIVGLNDWAYGWLALQVFIIVLKVVFSLEPIRRIPIVNVQSLVGEMTGDSPPVLASSSPDPPPKTRLPIIVDSSLEFSFREVCIHQNVVFEIETQLYWQSRTPGLFIGQPYYLQRPKLPEKQTMNSGSTVPTLVAPLRVASLGGKQAPDPEKTFIPPVAASISPPSSYRSPSPPGSLSSRSTRSTRSTAMPAMRAAGDITELPRIVVSTASSPVGALPANPIAPPIPTSPVSPDAPAVPPGIPLTRTTSSRTSIASRAPTPPAKPTVRSATPPSRPPTRSASPLSRNPSLRATPPHPPRPPKPNQPPPPIPIIAGVPIISAPKPKREPSAPLPPSPEPIRYLAMRDGKLTLSETEPQKEAKDALQREFLACLAEIVRANKVPSAEFLQAIETAREGIRKTMSDTWYLFGTADLLRYMRTAYRDLIWRKFL